MHKILRHGLVLFLTANLLVSTMGMTVHSLYCLCKDSLAISIFEQSPQCGKQASENLASCCKKNSEKICCTEEQGCQKKDKKYVKLKTQFILNEIGIDLQVPDFQITEKPGIIILDEVLTELTGENFNKPPPDKPYGKTLLPFIQSFIC